MNKEIMRVHAIKIEDGEKIETPNEITVAQCNERSYVTPPRINKPSRPKMADVPLQALEIIHFVLAVTITSPSAENAFIDPLRIQICPRRLGPFLDATGRCSKFKDRGCETA